MLNNIFQMITMTSILNYYSLVTKKKKKNEYKNVNNTIDTILLNI